MIQLPYEIKDNIKHYDFKKSWYYLQELGRVKFGKKFKLHASDREIIYKLLIYFIRDEESCVKYGLDLEKGILLNGPVGCGKTSLITLMKQFAYPDHNYIVKSARDVAIEFNDSGYPAIKKYGKSNKIYCFDDLGIENNIKHYGNECNTIAEVILCRNDLRIYEGIVTHATTNLNAEELEKLYGNRVRSRLRSMFNLVAFEKNSSDKRQ
ncbi:MAG: DNA replication protein DnaC [Crocinitomicaceae bacterium]|jgi:DNA replication protein DnaC